MKQALSLVLLMVFVAALAHAQPPAALKPEPEVVREKISDTELTELIESVMAARLAKELGLNEEQTVLMVRRFSDFREQLAEMKRLRQEKLRALRTALREKQSDEDVEAALQDLIAHDLQTLEFRKEAYQNAAGSLSTTQRAKLYVFVSDFEGDMRKLIQQARERRQGAGRPPVHPDGPQRPRPPKPAAPAAPPMPPAPPDAEGE